MNKKEYITNNIIQAILWAEHKFFDVPFHGQVLSNTLEAGFEVALKKYSNYFFHITELDTEDLPDEKTILGLFDENIALLSEDEFITGNNGVVKTDIQIFTASQLVKLLKGKKVYILNKEVKNG